MIRLPFDTEPALLKITTERERELYQKHFALLLDWNTRMALVSRKSIDKSFENHYADSIYISEFAHGYYSKGTVFDLGSGAGFPGALFGIRYPKIDVALFERVRKKNLFLNEIVAKLELSNVEVRGEWTNQRLAGLFLARAVTPRPELFQFFKERVSPGSIIIINSGSETELTPPPDDFKLLKTDRYSLPRDAGSRQIEAFERVPRGTTSKR